MKSIKENKKWDINSDGLIKKTDTLILGAGLTGLSAAYKLKKLGFKDILILEKGDRPGGLLKTNRKEGGAIDELPHVFFSKDKIAKDFFLKMVGKVINIPIIWGSCGKKAILIIPFKTIFINWKLKKEKKF